jgi:hypothetical protein
MSNHAKPFEFHPTDGSSNLSFRERLAIWCKKYLKDLRGGIYVYPHQNSAGKAIASTLRYHLLSQPVCEAAVAYGANTDFGPAIRHSEANPRATRDLPTQEQAKTQFWVDLFADDVRLLEHLIDKLGNEPAREEKAVWRTFSEKVFTKRKRSTSADPLDLAAHMAFEWMDLKLSDSSFEARLQSAWTATMDHLLIEVFTGDLKAAVGDVIAKDRHLIDSPQKLIDKIKECCKVVQDNQQQLRFFQALSGNGNGSSSAATSGATTSNPSRHPKDRRRSTERPGSNARPGQEPKPKENEPCRNFAAGKCTRGAQCKYSHAAQPPQQSAPTPPTAKRQKTASAKRLTATAEEIEEGGITYRLYKDGKYYEKSPCSFCWQPESAMGAKRHSNEDCPVKAKCTNREEQKRAYRSRCREKP